MRARKRFAQHFLESAWTQKVAAAIDPSPRDVFVEIGPGQGAITRVLAGTARHVAAVEIDRDLVADLRAGAPPTLDVIEADVLPFDLDALVRRLSAEHAEGGPVRLAGNLPYNISSPIIFKLLDTARETNLLADATLLLQQEVADRIVGEAGTKAWGPLAIAVQLAAEVRRVLALPPGAFRPAPKVRSALVRLTFRPQPVPIADRVLFDALVRSVFTQRRKTVGNAFRPFAGSRGANAAPVLARAGIDPRRRPETLSLGEFSALASALAEVAGA